MRLRYLSRYFMGLTLILVLTLAGSVFAQFSDLQGHWAEQQVTDWVNPLPRKKCFPWPLSTRSRILQILR